MVDMLVLADRTLPSPWTKVTSADGNYVRCAASGCWGTGGDSTHRHLSVPTYSESPGTSAAQSGTGATRLVVHNHLISATYSGDSSNDPLYYTLALWKIDYDTWHNDKAMPEGVVVLSYSSISSSGWTRWSAGDGRLIKLGFPGGSGGRSTHTNHSLSATLNDSSAGAEVKSGFGAFFGLVEDHPHSTVTISTVSSASLFPSLVKTRFYLVDDDIDEIPAGIVVFFDGTPRNHWELLSDWSGKFPMSANSSPDLVSGDHNHPNNSVSSNYASMNGGAVQSGSGAACVAGAHLHANYVTLGDTEAVPPFVHLIPYRLVSTQPLGAPPPEENSKTWSIDAVMKVARAASWSSSGRLLKGIEKTVPGSVALLKAVDEAVPGTVALLKAVDEAVPGTVALLKAVDEAVPGTVALLRTESVATDLTGRFLRVGEVPFGVDAALQLQDVVAEAEVGVLVRYVWAGGLDVSVFLARSRAVGTLLQSAFSCGSGAPCRISVSFARDYPRPRMPFVRETLRPAPSGGRPADPVRWDREGERAPLVRETLEPVPTGDRPSDPIDWGAIELKGREKVVRRWY